MKTMLRILGSTLSKSKLSGPNVVLLLALIFFISACGRTPAITSPGEEVTVPTGNEEQSEQPETEPEPEPEPDGSDEGGTDEPAEPALPIFDPSIVELSLTPLADGLSRPVYVDSPNDGSGRLFILEQPGSIRIWADGALAPEPFLDIQERVEDGGNEQGLLGLAFPPNFGETGHFFVNYTGANGTTFVSRFSLVEGDDNRADPASESVVMSIPQPAQNHNGGMLLFGPDGYLYIGTGDGGAANDRFGNGQNPTSLLGKMLRIDVTSDPSQPYLIPQDNPWINQDWTVEGQAMDVLDEIWSVGLRNPWRYSFDRLTNDLWIADVGQNKLEEVNYVGAAALAASATGSIAPLNFGWPIMEANDCFSGMGRCDSTGLELPVAEYDHSGHCSVTGGYVYRGAAYPALQGAYLYGDFCSGVIWATYADEAGTWRTAELIQSGLNISSFGEDEQGELYATALNGVIYRVEASIR